MEVPRLHATNLVSLHGVQHGFFTRQGGISTGPYASLNASLASSDDPSNVAQNHKIVAQEMGVKDDALVLCRQVHSDKAVLVTEAWGADARPEADAMVTRTSGVVLAILTADCAPVLLADPKACVIAAAHAGWRGAVGGVLESTLSLMEEEGATRSDIVAAIGPCIGPRSYEVGGDFLKAFEVAGQAAQRFFKPALRDGHFLFNLPGYIAAKLADLGVSNVAPSPADTFVEKDRFFSHRRGTVTGQPEEGRMLSCIALEG